MEPRLVGLELSSMFPNAGIIAILQTQLTYNHIILFPISSTKVVLGGIVAEMSWNSRYLLASAS